MGLNGLEVHHCCFDLWLNTELWGVGSRWDLGFLAIKARNPRQCQKQEQGGWVGRPDHSRAGQGYVDPWPETAQSRFGF